MSPRPCWRLLLCLPLLAGAGSALAQARIVEWSATTNTNPNDNQLALGYPVPIPVDTPLPFAGFRSYAGLLFRHQDLAANSGLVAASVIGTTQAGRDIWAYRIGDADDRTRSGAAEPAVLINGGIHAREWQSPEVVTGLMELLVGKAGDNGYYRFLLDNVNFVLIPVLNVDGFLQTQRFPRSNWIGSDPDDPPNSSQPSPRDGRMRRKNMLGADEVLSSFGDHLGGVDLNRNNPPFWASATGSSADGRSLVFRGSAPQSEPETAALVQAAALGPATALRLYMDAHSFGRELLWTRTANPRLTAQSEALVALFSNHHRAFPGARRYAFPLSNQLSVNVGIGTTSEFFNQAFSVPSWTLEIEPPGSSLSHPGELLCGAGYGGVVENCHDGFILPESEITRVREQLAETMSALAYRQSGPPSVVEVRITDRASGAMIFQSVWEADAAGGRRQIVHQTQHLQLERDYTLTIVYDKPMRWRNGEGVVVPFPGMSLANLITSQRLAGEQGLLSMITSNPRWIDQSAAVGERFWQYRDDTQAIDFRLPANPTNHSALATDAVLSLQHSAQDMTGLSLDADPSTVAHWQDGAWAGYENNAGLDNDRGGEDRTVRIAASGQTLGDPHLVQPGHSGAWFDPTRNGEGFVIEVLSSSQALAYFFTFDRDGEQDWYTMLGQIQGNRILFPQVARTSGGVFGPGFDPTRIERTEIGSASFTFASCNHGFVDWQIDGVALRTELQRITELAVPGCDHADLELPGRNWSGSWFDPSHDGEGYVLQILNNGTALVFWFGFDAEGRRRWYLGVGSIDAGTIRFDQLNTGRGPRFGPGFDPADFVPADWGSLRLDIGCQGSRASYQSAAPGFANGELSIVQLTHPSGDDCL
ncbi:MAG: M14 family zinc carboxypeptidase [Lysobacterales bacterium]